MLQRKRGKQQSMELVILEEMIPEDHLLRKIDRMIDFSFIRKMCLPLYCLHNGRPAIDPETLFRMLFVGYLYGIRSERRLEEEINYNLAYKWFCGLDILEKAPDASTISANRRRRFRENGIAEKIFNEILLQAVKRGLVCGKILYTDSTHVKAKANKHKKETKVIEVTPKEYMAELDAQIDADRAALGKKPLKPKDRDRGDKGNGGSGESGESGEEAIGEEVSGETPVESPAGSVETREIQVSRTDPESGQLHKEGKPDGFHYSEHRTVDSKCNVVVNVRITAANVNDVDPVPEILRDIRSRLGALPIYMGMDAGYHNARTCHLLAENGIQAVVGYRRHTHKGEHLGKYRFRYDPKEDNYQCPQGQTLLPRTVNREGYREYFSDAKLCKDCPIREKCLSEKSTRRLVTRHVWQGALDAADAFTKTAAGKALYKLRKQTIERSFAEAKELHGLRTARMLGLLNMREQSFLTAAIQNMKRIVKALASHFSLTILRLLYAQTQQVALSLLGLSSG